MPLTEQTVLDEVHLHYISNRHWHHRQGANYTNMPYSHVMWLAQGSSVREDIDHDTGDAILLWMFRNLKCKWCFCTRSNFIMRPSADGLRKVPEDILQELWISIEDPDSAMLSKLTWMGLRSPLSAEH